MKRKPPRQIIGYFKEPSTWDALAFETAIRSEVESQTGAITPSDEVLIGMLVLSVATFCEAHQLTLEHGMVSQYAAGQASSPYYRIRNESLDKIIKILGELALVARGRPKKQNKMTEVDELFTPA